MLRRPESPTLFPSERPKHVSFRSDVFTAVRSTTYNNTVDWVFKTPQPSRDMLLNVLGETPYKVHVNLSADDYLAYKDDICAILLKYVDAQQLSHYKYAEIGLVERKLQICARLYSATKDYHVRKNDADWLRTYKQKLHTYFPDLYDPSIHELSDEYLSRLKVELKNLWRSALRYQMGAQVTIYLQKGKESEMLPCLQEINDFLVARRAQHVAGCDVESSLTPYLYFRSEYLADDFDAMLERGCEQDFSLRIEAVQFDMSEREMARRLRIVEEQKVSTAFRFFRDGLNHRDEVLEVPASPRLAGGSAVAG